MRASLVVDRFSLTYVQKFTEYLHGVLRHHLDPDAAFLACDSVDEAQHPDGIVFLIGENLPPFRRRPGCRYVYLNFSVVSVLGSPFAASLSGHRQVFRKRRMLAARLPLYDMLLDFYAPQTRLLAHQLRLPVRGFDFAIAPVDAAPVHERSHQACFVGGITDRRKAVLDALEEAGVALSPSSGAAVEELAAKSLCCLNIHAQRSNHLEVPRLVAAFAAGCPVVTESSYGLAEFCDEDFVEERALSGIASAVEALLADPDRVQRLGKAAARWYRETYLPRAETRWRDLCHEIAGTEVPRDAA